MPTTQKPDPPRPSRIESADLATFAAVSAVVGRVTQRLDSVLDTLHGITLSEFLTLRTLSAYGPRGVRIQEAATQVGLNPSSMSRLITRLQNRGLVDRVTCDFDKRGVYAAISTTGSDLLADAEQAVAPALSAEFDYAAYQPATAAAITKLRHTPPPA